MQFLLIVGRVLQILSCSVVVAAILIEDEETPEKYLVKIPAKVPEYRPFFKNIKGDR